MTWQLRTAMFPKTVISGAQRTDRIYGVPACVSMAQWALESAYGRSLSGANNPFGIKWRPAFGPNFRTVWTWEVVNGKVVKVQARFASFSSYDKAFDTHGYMLARNDGYYGRSRRHMENWRAYVQAIAPIYATDPLYASKLIRIIEDYRLFDYNVIAPIDANPKAPL